MRRLAAVLVAAVLAGCSQQAQPPDAKPTLSSPVTRATTALPSPSLPVASQTAAVGGRLTLGRSATETVDVNVLEILDPATGSSPPPPGSRYVAVRMEISNPGGPSYTERALEGSLLIDALGVAHRALRNEPVRGGFGAAVAIRRGGFHRGFVSFAISQGVRVAAFRFTPQGQQPETGEWRAG